MARLWLRYVPGVPPEGGGRRKTLFTAEWGLAYLIGIVVLPLAVWRVVGGLIRVFALGIHLPPLDNTAQELRDVARFFLPLSVVALLVLVFSALILYWAFVGQRGAFAISDSSSEGLRRKRLVAASLALVVAMAAVGLAHLSESVAEAKADVVRRN